MDKAMSGKIGKKWAAILAGCVWAIFALAASVAFRTVTAKAASDDGGITIMATSEDNIEGGSSGEFVWGKIYRGITLLTTANYDVNGAQGSVTITTINASTVSIGNVDGSPLNDRSHGEHDFTAGAGSGSWESTTNGHYAVCSCGIKLEVAHRPSEGDKNACADCNMSVLNEYSFSFDDAVEWNPQSGATVTLTINHIYLFAGFVLKLNLDCAGALKTENGAEISYTVAVTGARITGETPSKPSGGNGAETIWQLSAASNLRGSSDMRTNINSGSITVTLSPSGGGDSSSAYAGTYTDTLTFSVTLETE